MKKGLLISMLVGSLLSVSGTALAFSVKFNGDLNLQECSVNDGIAGTTADKENFSQFRMRLNATGQIDENISLFTRFVNFSYINSQSSAYDQQGQIDQYGIKMKSHNWNFSVGRQSVTLGQGAIISTGDDAGVGEDDQFDGVIASTTMGNVNFDFIGGKTTTANGSFLTGYPDGNSFSAEVYGFDASSKLANNVTVGVAYGVNKDQPNIPSLKNWAVNATVNTSPNLAWNAEYVKSNASTNNTAYFVSGTYSFAKDSITIQYNNVQGNAVDPYYSGIGAAAYPLISGANLGPVTTLATTPNYKGFTYTYDHPINKRMDLNIAYMDLKADSVKVNNKELTAGVQWKF